MGFSVRPSLAFWLRGWGTRRSGSVHQTLFFVAVASSIVGREGVLGLSVSTLFAGVLLIFLGSVRLGTAVSMVPRPVVLGFSTGIAVLVVSGLLFNLLGTRSQILADEIRERAMTVPQIMAIDPKAIALATGTLILTMGGRRVFRFQYVPGGLIAIVMGALLVRFWHFPARTIEQSCASTLMSLHLYLTGLLRLDLLGSVLAQAFAIAILVAMESLHAMGHAATLTGERLNPNRELLVHGGVNIACSVVGGLPASGVCVYTSTNARAGAQTPVAGMLHALFLLGLLLLMAPLVRFIPLPVISAVLLSSVCSMTHWREIPRLMKGPRADAGAWLATSLLTVATDLPMAIAAGTLIGMFLYIRKQRCATGNARQFD
jgi:SulP family sulfate permease